MYIWISSHGAVVALFFRKPEERKCPTTTRLGGIIVEIIINRLISKHCR